MTILTGYLSNFGFIIFYENLEIIEKITGFHIAIKNDKNQTKYTMFPTHSLHRYGGLLLSCGYQILIKSEYNSDNSDNSIFIKDCYQDESS